ncbi:MAG: hypothetical protein N2748_02995, partial [candidate division WOR-3 bacterium]|nr:hypothetical protein [candidate division WOR-3 bacterium]
MNTIKNKYWVGCCLIVTISCSLASAQALQISGGNTAEYWLFIDSLKEHIEDKLKLSISYNEFILSSKFFLWQPALPNLKRM